MRILVVEDDVKIAENLKILLSEKFHVNTVGSVDDASIELLSGDYDLAIIDWMLPDGSGVECVTELRADDVSIPILMLTARSQTDDIVVGLESGADDYLTKPFKSRELLARVSTLLRRRQSEYQQHITKVGELSIDSKNRVVLVGEDQIALSPREFELLEYLVRNKNQPIDRLTLLAHVWGGSIDELSNTVDVHIRYLRKKLGLAAAYIKTVKGVGYSLCDPEN